MTMSSLGLVAQEAIVERIDIVRSGLYQLHVSGTVFDQSLVGRHRERLASWRHVSSQTTFPVRRCESFGFDYRVVGTPKGANVPLRMVTYFPATGLRDPNTGALVFQQETHIVQRIGEPHVRTYTIHDGWEAVPGEWRFEIWYRNRRLALQTFYLQPPCAGDCEALTTDACAPRLSSLEHVCLRRNHSRRF